MNVLKTTPLLLIAFSIFCYSPLNAQNVSGDEEAHIFHKNDADIEWDSCSEFMPDDCRFAVLQGNPAEPNADVFFKLQGKSEVANHVHTSAERMILVSGELLVDFEGQDPVVMKPGTYAYGPATSVPASAALSAAAPEATIPGDQNQKRSRARPYSDPDSLSAIGNTPLLKLHHLPDSNGAEIWVKWEGANPTGSMKDRMALGMIEAAEKSGDLKPGMRIVEVTGGSTGSSLAMMCRPRGYRAHFVTTDAISIEKRRTMAALGATLEIMPSHGLGITPELVERSIARVHELERDPDTFWTNQFGNPANAAGYIRLGHEILEAGPWDAFVMGVGTGGCLSGVASVLKQNNSESNPLVVAVEPAASRNLSGGSTGGHRIEEIGIGFVPDTARVDLIDEIVAVSDEEAFETTRALARQEGLFAGPSSGANVAAAMRIAKKLGSGNRVVTLLCDSGLRYLSDNLFETGDG